MIELRDSQKEAFESIKTEFKKGNRKVILQAQTGFGKTYLFSYITAKAIESKSTVLIITDRKELLSQSGIALQIWGADGGILEAKDKEAPDTNVVIAMLETIKRREYYQWVKKFDIVICDEVHSQAFDRLLEHLEPNQYAIGFTATPYRKGAKTTPLSKFFNTLITTTSTSALIKQGVLSKAKSYGIPLDFSNVSLKRGEFDSKGIQALYEKNNVFNGVIENYNRITPGSKTLLFSASVETSVKMCDNLNKNGITAKHIDANSKNRTNILKAFANNEFKVLCNVGILTTGYDCPSIETIILYRATMSLPLFLQMVGRGSRTTETKNTFTILDFGGNIQRHNFWESDRVWSLDIMQKPKKIGAQSVKNCPNCGAFIPSVHKKCTYCGFELPKTKEERIVELVSLEPSKLDFEKIDECVKLGIHKQGYYLRQMNIEKLKEYAKYKGYAQGWLFRKRQIYGI